MARRRWSGPDGPDDGGDVMPAFFSPRWPAKHTGETWKRACAERRQWLIARGIDPTDFQTWNPIARRSEVVHGIANTHDPRVFERVTAGRVRSSDG